MVPISNTTPRPVSGVEAAERVREAAPVRENAPAESGSRKPQRDEYIPEEARESYGRYWVERDEEGNPKIRFDDPEAADSSPVSLKPEDPEGEQEPAAPEKAAPSGKGRKEEKCTGNTDAVDREIERLKKKKEELERQIDRETDETKRESLERRLAQVEDELRRKDNDTYRRQHSTFTNS